MNYSPSNKNDIYTAFEAALPNIGMSYSFVLIDLLLLLLLLLLLCFSNLRSASPIMTLFSFPCLNQHHHRDKFSHTRLSSIDLQTLFQLLVTILPDKSTQVSNDEQTIDAYIGQLLGSFSS